MCRASAVLKNALHLMVKQCSGKLKPTEAKSPDTSACNIHSVVTFLPLLRLHPCHEAVTPLPLCHVGAIRAFRALCSQAGCPPSLHCYPSNIRAALRANTLLHTSPLNSRRPCSAVMSTSMQTNVSCCVRCTTSGMPSDARCRYCRGSAHLVTTPVSHNLCCTT